VTRCVCEKIAQNVAQAIICKNLCITGTVEKVALKFALHTSVIFKTQPQVNNRPIGQNLPNLVTLTINVANFQQTCP
jgi:hypothetical protein